MSVAIPESHLDLLTRPIHGVLTTMLADGQPQSSLVWCSYDGECPCVNTTLERQKGRNLTANPKASLLLVDPKSRKLYFKVATGEKGTAVKRFQLDLGQGIAGHVACTGMPLLIPDVARDVDGPGGDPLWPALRSDGQSLDADAVPMGAWLRLRADVDLTGAPPAVRVVATALQVHGLLLGDTGGTADAIHLKLEKSDAWRGPDGADAEAALAGIGAWITIGDFEVVDPTPMRSDRGSFAIR